MIFALVPGAEKDGWVHYEYKRVKVRPPPIPSASVWPAEHQMLYLTLAARDGDWRALQGTKPTEMMLRLFPTARAKYLQWRKRQDEEEDRIRAAPHEWVEVAPGKWSWEVVGGTRTSFVSEQRSSESASADRSGSEASDPDRTVRIRKNDSGSEHHPERT